VTRLSRFSFVSIGASLWRAAGPAIAFALLVEAGCLVPQTVQSETSQEHQAPQILVEDIPQDLLAPVLTLYRQGADDATASPVCHCEMELSAPFVEEDDTTLSLSVLWFLDYNPSVPTSTRALQGTPVSLPGFVTDVIRAVPPYEFDADALGIVTSGQHIVEVVIGETDGFDHNSTTLPDRAMLSGYHSTEYKWVVQVNTQPDPAQPKCPDTPPLSVRVCK
jgi:hypothetical protein